MARSFSVVQKLVSLSVALNKRGFAKGATATGGKGGKVVAKATEESSSSMWVPDPVTGYYRPENQAIQVDAADLRKRLLIRKVMTSN